MSISHQSSNFIKDPQPRGGDAASAASHWLLIHQQHTFQMFSSADRGNTGTHGLLTYTGLQAGQQVRVQSFCHQGALATAADTADTTQDSQRKLHIRTDQIAAVNIGEPQPVLRCAQISETRCAGSRAGLCMTTCQQSSRGGILLRPAVPAGPGTRCDHRHHRHRVLFRSPRPPPGSLSDRVPPRPRCFRPAAVPESQSSRGRYRPGADLVLVRPAHTVFLSVRS